MQVSSIPGRVIVLFQVKSKRLFVNDSYLRRLYILVAEGSVRIFGRQFEIGTGQDVAFFNSKATAGGFAKLIIVNALILLLTFGIGYAWVVSRTMSFIMNNIEISGHLSIESLEQAQAEYSDATGDDMSDMLEVGII